MGEVTVKTNRRQFLKGAAALSVAASALTDTPTPVRIHDAAHHEMTNGFGLAPIKAEGQTYLLDPLDDITTDSVAAHTTEPSDDIASDDERKTAYDVWTMQAGDGQ